MRAWGPGIPRRAGLGGDAALYAASAAVAGWLLATSTFDTFRLWAILAGPCYLAALLATGIIAGWAVRVLQTESVDVEGRVLRARLAVLGAVTIGSCLLPTGVAVARRATKGPEYAQSEVVIIESAARLLLHGSDPYAAWFGSEELAGRAAGIREHFPYLPGMAVFGLPRALLGGAWTDARIVVLTVALVAALLASARLGSRGVRMWQVLVAAPTGALALTAGEHDIALLALATVALILLDERRTTAGLLLLVALACTKQTLWPLLLAVLLSLPAGRLRRGHVLLAVGVPATVLTATLLWSSRAFDDLVVYPLGLTDHPTPATSPTLGSLLMAGLADEPRWLRTLVALGLLAMVVAAVQIALRAPPWRDLLLIPDSWSARAAIRFGLLISCLFAAAPAARPGYAVYPLVALAWVFLLDPGVVRVDSGGGEEHYSRRTVAGSPGDEAVRAS